MKLCKICNVEKDESQYYRKLDRQKQPYYGSCKSCVKARTTYNRNRSDQTERHRHERLNNLRVDYWIYHSSRGADRKRGMENNLTKVHIANQIKNGCVYCGETQMRMTLDRIDNARGHTIDNCVPACIRCNYMRGNMPYVAWLLLCPAVRQARETGAFGSWTGRARSVDVRRSKTATARAT